VCNTTKSGSIGKYYDVIEKSVDCRKLFSHHRDIDKTSRFSAPPMKVPKYLWEDFTYQVRTIATAALQIELDFSAVPLEVGVQSWRWDVPFQGCRFDFTFRELTD
jgi:hypothetical protein